MVGGVGTSPDGRQVAFTLITQAARNMWFRPLPGSQHSQAIRPQAALPKAWIITKHCSQESTSPSLSL